MTMYLEEPHQSESATLKTIYLSMYSINCMLDAASVLALTRHSHVAPGGETSRYINVGTVLLEIASLVPYINLDSTVKDELSLHEFSSSVLKFVLGFIDSQKIKDSSDIQWLKKLSIDCQSKAVRDCIDKNQSEHPLFESNLNTLQLIKYASLTGNTELILSINIRFETFKAFALNGCRLFINKSYEAQSDRSSELQNFFEKTQSYFPLVWLSESIISTTPQRNFDSPDAIEAYILQIQNKFQLFQIWCESDNYVDLMLGLLKECLNQARLAAHATFQNTFVEDHTY
jgi:hypothetical protein